MAEQTGRRRRRRWPLLVAASLLFALLGPGTSAAATSNDVEVPFVGSSENQAIDAVPVDPTHVLVTTVGEGTASLLGAFTFVSPHLSGLVDFSIDGPQFFTAADGSELHSHLRGNLRPVINADGTVDLVGDVPATVTGGTGRFENASGEFTFSLVFDLATLSSTAQIDGTILLDRGAGG